MAEVQAQRQTEGQEWNQGGGPHLGEVARHWLLAGLPVTERRLALAGISTAVLAGGDGPPVVLLHGPMGNATHWMELIPGLVTTHRVIVPDLPGHGDSDAFGNADTHATVEPLLQLRVVSAAGAGGGPRDGARRPRYAQYRQRFPAAPAGDAAGRERRFGAGLYPADAAAGDRLGGERLAAGVVADSTRQPWPDDRAPAPRLADPARRALSAETYLRRQPPPGAGIT